MDVGKEMVTDKAMATNMDWNTRWDMECETWSGIRIGTLTQTLTRTRTWTSQLKSLYRILTGPIFGSSNFVGYLNRLKYQYRDLSDIGIWDLWSNKFFLRYQIKALNVGSDVADLMYDVSARRWIWEKILRINKYLCYQQQKAEHL